MDYSLSFNVNDRNYNFDVKSKNFKRRENECIFDDTLFKNQEFLKEGYIIRPFPKDYFNAIKESITKYVAGLIGNPEHFTLETYHEYVNDTKHKEVINTFRGGFIGAGGIHLDYLGIPYEKFDEYINQTIKSSNLSCHYKRYGLSVKHFWIRIVRPNSKDNNPPHKDAHLKRMRKNINIYLPLAGSNMNSSLPIIPRSHLELESEYIVSDSPSIIEGRRFSVPAVVHRNKGLNMITPNPKTSEILIFTPYLIHGGGVNSNKKTTRVSLEMRFFS
jgi:hypothetical protein